jgi:hypothetical protein
MADLKRDELAVVRSTDPKLIGWYRMSANYGVYLFEWPLNGRDGRSLFVRYNGHWPEPQDTSVDIKVSRTRPPD